VRSRIADRASGIGHRASRIVHRPTIDYRLSTILLLIPFAASAIAHAQTSSPEIASRPPNPHWDPQGCALCHGEGQPGAISATASEALCARCHDAASVARLIHPLGMGPGRFASLMEENHVPLVDGEVGCVSCHDLLVQCFGGQDAQSSNRFFLRGPAGGDIVGSCFLCHPTREFSREDPHRQVNADGSLRFDQCRICHGPSYQPEVSARPAEVHLSLPEPGLCAGCHPLRAHPRGVNHLVVPDEAVRLQMIYSEHRDELQGMTQRQAERFLTRQPERPQVLPLGPDGQIVCSTCHNPHERGVLPASNPRSLGAEANPPRNHRLRHDAEALCASCHAK
jgi:hypothetical protein